MKELGLLQSSVSNCVCCAATLKINFILSDRSFKKTKGFITHGGTNGLYEAIYHGVPMVGLPLFADQPDNLMHMKTKGAAVVLDINKMQSEDLVDALKTVLNNPS